MRRVLVILPLVVLLASSAAAAAAPAFAAGQVWNYRTRWQDAGSQLRIWRIDPGAPGRRVVHISIIGMADWRGRALPEIQHIAVAEAALRKSATSLADSDAVFPDPAPSYAEWKKVKGPVWSGTLVSLIDTVAKSVQPK